MATLRSRGSDMIPTVLATGSIVARIIVSVRAYSSFSRLSTPIRRRLMRSFRSQSGRTTGASAGSFGSPPAATATGVVAATLLDRLSAW